VEVSFEKTAVEAGTRRLGARWSIELEQDLKNMNGIDIDAELTNAMSYEIQAEIDREMIIRMIQAALNGGLNSGYSVWSPASADGRWLAERNRDFYQKLIVEANRIAVRNRRGAANFIVATPRVCAILEMLPKIAKDVGVTTRWVPKEISLVPIGADPKAKMRQESGVGHVARATEPGSAGNSLKGSAPMPKALRDFLAVADVPRQRRTLTGESSACAHVGRIDPVGREVARRPTAADGRPEIHETRVHQEHGRSRLNIGADDLAGVLIHLEPAVDAHRCVGCEIGLIFCIGRREKHRLYRSREIFEGEHRHQLPLLGAADTALGDNAGHLAFHAGASLISSASGFFE
jgi:hypothetical protein